VIPWFCIVSVVVMICRSSGISLSAVVAIGRSGSDSMVMHVIVNRIRRGKTALLVFQTAIKAAKDFKVYSNFYTAFTDERVYGLSQLESMRRGWFAFDDAYRWINSRVKNIGGIDLIMSLSGKRHIDIGWTTTRTNQVDINMRINSDYIWWPFLSPDKRILVGRMYEYYPERGTSDEERTGELRKTIAFPSSPIFRWYDTEEEIQDFGRKPIDAYDNDKLHAVGRIVSRELESLLPARPLIEDGVPIPREHLSVIEDVQEQVNQVGSL
jgi:hypothetical protein